jgi:hypothetical protein
MKNTPKGPKLPITNPEKGVIEKASVMMLEGRSARHRGKSVIFYFPKVDRRESRSTITQKIHGNVLFPCKTPT